MPKIERYSGIAVIVVVLGLFSVFIALTFFQPEEAKAQCGSAASSCKSCHEVENQHPVNSDGTGWHQSHAFGDFCTLCHAGNQQATSKLEAHVGLVAPMADAKASCQACHPNDLNARVEVYTAVLKQTPGSNIGASGPAVPAISTESLGMDGALQAPSLPTSVATAEALGDNGPVASASPVGSTALTNEIIVSDPNAVDYVQRYDEIVLGKRPVNWGNITLIVIIALIVVGGGGFVIFNEMRIAQVKSISISGEATYPVDVIALLPAITRLKQHSREVLRNILNHPQKTDKVLSAIDTLVSNEKSEE